MYVCMTVGCKEKQSLSATTGGQRLKPELKRWSGCMFIYLKWTWPTKRREIRKKSFEPELIAVLTLVRSPHPLNYDCADSLEFLSDIFHKDAAQRRSRKNEPAEGKCIVFLI